jgi:hypothetical protein
MCPVIVKKRSCEYISTGPRLPLRDLASDDDVYPSPEGEFGVRI